FNPIKLVTDGGRLALAPVGPSGAWAADPAVVESDTYGIPDYGFTDAELNRYSIKDNTAYVQAHSADFAKFESSCFKNSFGDALDAQRTDPSNCTGQDEASLHFRIYELDRRATHDLLLLYNNQPGGQ